MSDTQSQRPDSTLGEFAAEIMGTAAPATPTDAQLVALIKSAQSGNAASIAQMSQIAQSGRSGSPAGIQLTHRLYILGKKMGVTQLQGDAVRRPRSKLATTASLSAVSKAVQTVKKAASGDAAAQAVISNVADKAKAGDPAAKQTAARLAVVARDAKLPIARQPVTSSGAHVTVLGAWLHKLNPLYWLKSQRERALIDIEEKRLDEFKRSKKVARKQRQEVFQAEKAVAATEAARAAASSSAQTEQKLAAIETALSATSGMGAAQAAKGRKLAAKVHVVSDALATKLAAGKGLTPKEFSHLQRAVQTSAQLRKLGDAIISAEQGDVSGEYAAEILGASIRAASDPVKQHEALGKTLPKEVWTKLLALKASNPSQIPAFLKSQSLPALSSEQQKHLGRLQSTEKALTRTLIKNGKFSGKVPSAVLGADAPEGKKLPKKTWVAMTSVAVTNPAKLPAFLQKNNLALTGRQKTDLANLTALTAKTIRQQARPGAVPSDQSGGVWDVVKQVANVAIAPVRLAAQGTQWIAQKTGLLPKPRKPPSAEQQTAAMYQARAARMEAARQRGLAARRRAMAADAQTRAAQAEMFAAARAAAAEAEAQEAEAAAQEAQIDAEHSQYSTADDFEAMADQSGWWSPAVPLGNKNENLLVPQTPGQTPSTFAGADDFGWWSAAVPLGNKNEDLVVPQTPGQTPSTFAGWWSAAVPLGNKNENLVVPQTPGQTPSTFAGDFVDGDFVDGDFVDGEDAVAVKKNIIDVVTKVKNKDASLTVDQLRKAAAQAEKVGSKTLSKFLANAAGGKSQMKGAFVGAFVGEDDFKGEWVGAVPPKGQKIVAAAASKTKTGQKIRAGASVVRAAKSGNPKAKVAIAKVNRKAKAGDLQAKKDLDAIKAGKLALEYKRKAKAQGVLRAKLAAQAKRNMATRAKLEAAAASALARQSRKVQLAKVARVERAAAAGHKPSIVAVKKTAAAAKAGDKKAQTRLAALKTAKEVRVQSRSPRERAALREASKTVARAQKGNKEALQKVRVVQAAAKTGQPNAKRALQRLKTAAKVERAVATGFIGTAVGLKAAQVAKRNKQKAEYARLKANFDKIQRGYDARDVDALIARGLLSPKQRAQALKVLASQPPADTTSKTAALVAQKLVDRKNAPAASKALSSSVPARRGASRKVVADLKQVGKPASTSASTPAVSAASSQQMNQMVASTQRRVSAGVASQEEATAAARTAAQLSKDPNLSPPQQQAAQQAAGQLAAQAATLPSATQDLKQTALTAAAVQAQNPAATAHIQKTLNSAEAGVPAAINEAGKLAAVRTIDELNQGQPMTRPMAEAVDLVQRGQANDPAAIEAIQAAGAKAPLGDKAAIEASIALTAAAALLAASASKPTAKAEIEDAASKTLGRHIGPEQAKDAQSQLDDLLARAKRGEATPEEAVKGRALAMGLRKPFVAAEISALMPAPLPTDPRSNMAEGPLPPITGFGSLIKESLKALLFATTNPLQNYREGVISRSTTSSIPTPESFASGMGAWWNPLSWGKSKPQPAQPAPTAPVIVDTYTITETTHPPATPPPFSPYDDAAQTSRLRELLNRVKARSATAAEAQEATNLARSLNKPKLAERLGVRAQRLSSGRGGASRHQQRGRFGQPSRFARRARRR